MNMIIPNSFIDDVPLHKSIAANKMTKLMSYANTCKHSKMIKTASVDHDKLITLFTQMMTALNMSSNGNVKEIINKIAEESTDLNKIASISKHSMERKDDIKIVSKSVKDSHYQIDVSKDLIKQNGKKVIMISCYARDAYLGRYLIKRNYFYTEDRNKFANDTYDEIITKINAIKDRYYNEIIDPHGISEQIKQVLNGVVSEIEIKEDSLGTTVNRNT